MKLKRNPKKKLVVVVMLDALEWTAVELQLSEII
jgi:hypothetical protein